MFSVKLSIHAGRLPPRIPQNAVPKPAATTQPGLHRPPYPQAQQQPASQNIAIEVNTNGAFSISLMLHSDATLVALDIASDTPYAPASQPLLELPHAAYRPARQAALLPPQQGRILKNA